MCFFFFFSGGFRAGWAFFGGVFFRVGCLPVALGVAGRSLSDVRFFWRRLAAILWAMCGLLRVFAPRELFGGNVLLLALKIGANPKTTRNF